MKEFREHITDGGHCWCNPVVEEFSTGTKLFIHNDPEETPDTIPPEETSESNNGI